MVAGGGDDFDKMEVGSEDEEEPETVRPEELMAPPFNLSHVQARAIIRDCRYSMKHWCEEDKGPEQSAPQSDEMRAYVDQRIENLEAKLEETMSMLQKALELKSPNGLPPARSTPTIAIQEVHGGL